MAFGLTNDGFSLKVSSEENHVSIEENIEFAHQVAQKPQHDNILKQLSKLGNTIFEAEEILINKGADKFFIPSSLLSDLRRKAISAFESAI